MTPDIEKHRPLLSSKNLNRGGNLSFPAINGLRTYAAIGIVAMHVLANIDIKPTENLITKSIIGPMGELVLLFMMISAFGICCGYYERVKAGKISPSEFYKKRYTRILPFFALLVSIDLVQSFSWSTLAESFSNITLVFGLYPECNITVIGVGWFLGTIFVFYMLFPFFTFLIDNKRRAWIVLLISIIWQILMMHHYAAPSNKQILFSAPYFIIGGIVYLYREDIVKTFSKSHHIPLLGATGCMVLTFIYIIIPEINQTILGRNLPRIILYTAWLCYAVGANLWILNNKFTTYISGISMEIYLCHMVIYRVIEKAHLHNYIADNNLNYICVLSLTLLGAAAFSHLTKYWILPQLRTLILNKRK